MEPRNGPLWSGGGGHGGLLPSAILILAWEWGTGSRTLFVFRFIGCGRCMPRWPVVPTPPAPAPHTGQPEPKREVWAAPKPQPRPQTAQMRSVLGPLVRLRWRAVVLRFGVAWSDEHCPHSAYFAVAALCRMQVSASVARTTRPLPFRPHPSRPQTTHLPRLFVKHATRPGPPHTRHDPPPRGRDNARHCSANTFNFPPGPR